MNMTLLVRAGGGDEGKGQPCATASCGFASSDRKEAVVMGAAAEVEDGEKDSCSHRDASVSGVGELRNMPNSGVHGSIFRRRPFVSQIGRAHV